MDGDGVHDDHDDEHAGHDHEEHALMMNHMLSKDCLSKSDALGVFTEGQQDTAFDQTEAITGSLKAQFWPLEYFICINKEGYLMRSIQLTFADGEGEQQAKLPLIGPSDGEEIVCGTF